MKEPKVEKVEELKLQIEELEERIAPAFVVTLPTGETPSFGAGTSAHDGLVTASGETTQISHETNACN